MSSTDFSQYLVANQVKIVFFLMKLMKGHRSIDIGSMAITQCANVSFDGFLLIQSACDNVALNSPMGYTPLHLSVADIRKGLFRASDNVFGTLIKICFKIKICENMYALTQTHTP